MPNFEKADQRLVACRGARCSHELEAPDKLDCCVFFVASQLFLENCNIASGAALSGMGATNYESHCERCAALCCLVLPFDRSPAFAFDKPALVPCAELRGHRCRIHAQLETRGFAGCAAYQCLGAGPRVLHEVFGGRSWRVEPSLAPAMANAFAAMRDVQELGLLLELARDLPLCAEERARLETFMSELEAPSGWSLASLVDFERGSLATEVATFLRSLRRHVPARRRLPLLDASEPEFPPFSGRT